MDPAPSIARRRPPYSRPHDRAHPRLTVVVHQRKVEHGAAVAAVGGALEPADSLKAVSRYTITPSIDIPQGELSFRMSLACRFLR